MAPLVLVTGGTGFLAKWVIAQLLQQNYRVRTTVRDLSREDEVHASILSAGIDQDRVFSLEVVSADLLSDDGWNTALKDVDYVQHIASPLPKSPPKDVRKILRPAIEGTRRVLRLSKEFGVKRVVVTSSVAAMFYGPANTEKRRFTEEDWTDLSGDPNSVPLYARSKTLAERAAWDFWKNESKCSNSKTEVTVINPAVILGPALGREDATSLRAVGELLEGTTLGIPRVQWGVVDVRDCARMHLLAMTKPNAAGERFICVGEGSLWMSDIAEILKKNLGDRAAQVPGTRLPNLLVRFVALIMPIARLILHDVGIERKITAEKAARILGWKWEYNGEEAILAAATSLIDSNQAKVSMA